MSVEKFEIGDEVRLIRTEEMFILPRYKGQEGVIVESDSDDNYRVQFTDGWWYAQDDDLEPASQRNVFYVVDEESGDVTAEHTNQDAAVADAKATADQTNANNGIGVYKRLVIFKTKHEVVEERA